MKEMRAQTNLSGHSILFIPIIYLFPANGYAGEKEKIDIALVIQSV